MSEKQHGEMKKAQKEWRKEQNQMKKGKEKIWREQMIAKSCKSRRGNCLKENKVDPFSAAKTNALW